MTNAVIKAFVDLDSLRSCANDPGMVDEGLKEQARAAALPPCAECGGWFDAWVAEPRAQCVALASHTVSYTHLTLPTILLV